LTTGELTREASNTRVCGIYRCSVTKSALNGVYVSHPIFTTCVQAQFRWIRLDQHQSPTEGSQDDDGTQGHRMPQTQVASLTMVHRVAVARLSPLCRL
jgi:hypothetical protein